MTVLGYSINEHNERQPKGKVRFVVIDVPWKIFSQTGNIEAYLWMKQIELDETTETDQESLDDSLLEDTHF
ncbi:YqzL family protein [Gracilibacillus xinjiangensis]|uniref:YqzL family protein n=1 Tax=Gracilibacillus xinjiangensis TaxID=1193282 RepID=A0ABV8WXJ5_9BACI